MVRESETCKHRIYHHSLQIELQRLFRFGADTYHTDADKLGNLAPGHGVEHLEASEQVEYELRHAVVSRDRQVHHNLDNQEYVDTATEVVIHLLLFLCFFKSHEGKVLERYLEAEHEAVAERVAMQEIHIILLYDRELAPVLKHIVVFKASLDTDEKLSLHSSELRAEAYTEAAVLGTRPYGGVCEV